MCQSCPSYVHKPFFLFLSISLFQGNQNGAANEGKIPCYKLNGHITTPGLKFLVEYAYTGSLELPNDMVSFEQ